MKTFYLEVTPIHLETSRSRQTQRQVIGDELVINLRVLDEDQLTELFFIIVLIIWKWSQMEEKLSSDVGWRHFSLGKKRLDSQGATIVKGTGGDNGDIYQSIN